jgi:hypothetical protein
MTMKMVTTVIQFQYCVSHTVHYKAINWRKVTNKCNIIVLSVLKIYLFIYLQHRHVSAIPSYYQSACYKVESSTHHYTEQVKQSNISDILFIILTHGKLKQKHLRK